MFDASVCPENRHLLCKSINNNKRDERLPGIPSLVAVKHRWLDPRMVAAGVDVFCIAPGAIDTPMFQASSLNHLSNTQRAEFIGKLAQARLIPPREIAEQIVFLCR